MYAKDVSFITKALSSLAVSNTVSSTTSAVTVQYIAMHNVKVERWHAPPHWCFWTGGRIQVAFFIGEVHYNQIAAHPRASDVQPVPYRPQPRQGDRAWQARPVPSPPFTPPPPRGAVPPCPAADVPPPAAHCRPFPPPTAALPVAEHGSPRASGAAPPAPSPPPRRLLQAQHPQSAAALHPRYPRQLHARGQRRLLPMVSAGAAALCPPLLPAAPAAFPPSARGEREPRPPGTAPCRGESRAARPPATRAHVASALRLLPVRNPWGETPFPPRSHTCPRTAALLPLTPCSSAGVGTPPGLRAPSPL